VITFYWQGVYNFQNYTDNSQSLTYQYFLQISQWIFDFLGRNSYMTASLIGNNMLVRQVRIKVIMWLAEITQAARWHEKTWWRISVYILGLCSGLLLPFLLSWFETLKVFGIKHRLLWHLAQYIICWKYKRFLKILCYALLL
jgi:uncharacterized membrane protein required for colicin V production